MKGMICWRPHVTNLKIFDFRETKKREHLVRALLKTQGKPFYICILLIILLMRESMRRKQQARKALSCASVEFERLI